VRTILRNPRYRGLVVWGKTKNMRSPKSGKRVYRPRPEREWVRTEIPEQRIISEELWNRVEARRAKVNRLYRDANRRNGLMHTRQMNSSYLFSGILKCGECGANLTILWGKGRNKSTQVYGCPSNWNRGVCKNIARIRRDYLETSMLSQLQDEILREEVLDYVLEKFESGLLRELENMGSEMNRLDTRKRELEGELANLTRALAGGQLSPTIMVAIAEREREVSEITERAISSSGDSIKTRIAAMRIAAKTKLKDLRGLLGGDVAVAQAALLNHVDKIQMEPNGKVYTAKGNWDLLGQLPRDGAGGPVATERHIPFTIKVAA
jgi:site-specific DNA recombinase